MAKRRSFRINTTEELKAALDGARNIGQYKRALCLWLRATLGLNAIQVATVLGWTPQAVRNFHWRYMNKGLALLQGPGRGGRRHSLLKLVEERALLRRLRRKAWPHPTLEFRIIHREVERAAGRRVDAAIVRRLLERHHWRVFALAYVVGGSIALPQEEPAGSFALGGIHYCPPTREDRKIDE
jgi:transposase